MQLEVQIEDMNKEFSQKLATLVEERERYQKEVNQEFSVNEAIKERQNDYIEVLKKELLLARNIIKTPVLLEQTYKKVNLDDVEFYRHELVHKEPDVTDIDIKAKARRDRRAVMSLNEREKRTASLIGDGHTADGGSFFGANPKFEASQKVQWKGSRLRESIGNPETSTLN